MTGRARVEDGDRFAALAACVPAGASVVDVGTDHGALLVRLLERPDDERPVRCIGTDIHRRPLEGARRRLPMLPDEDLRLGDGLGVVAPGEVDTICAAGMGGGTIARILRAAPEVVQNVKRLVLQPFGHVPYLRETMSKLGFGLVSERCALRRGRLQITLVAEPGDVGRGYRDLPGAPPPGAGFVLGPWLVRSRACRELVMASLGRDLDALRRQAARGRRGLGVGRVGRRIGDRPTGVPPAPDDAAVDSLAPLDARITRIAAALDWAERNTDALDAYG